MTVIERFPPRRATRDSLIASDGIAFARRDEAKGGHRIERARLRALPLNAPATISAAETKIARRYQELGAVLHHFAAVGYRKSQTFIAGHSAGAWAALWALAEHPNEFAGAIAFAPAFAGRPGRPPGWDDLRTLAIKGIARANSIPSLVYAFQGDEWEGPDELAQIFGSLPGVKLITKVGRKVKMLASSPMYFHCGVYHRRFEQEERDNILAFISDHL